MTLVSEDRYRQITRDVTTASVSVTGQLVEAQRIIEDELRRPLEYGTGTETLPVYRDPDSGRGCVYPRRYPIESVPADVGYQVGSPAELIGVATPVTDWIIEGGQLGSSASVTVTGGWRAVDDPSVTDANRIPAKLERAIALLARALLVQPVEALPAGVTAASVGDVSVTYGGPQEGGPLGLVPGLCDLIDGYEYRPYL